MLPLALLLASHPVPATLDITTFGAIPDDGASDSAAINAAIAAAAPGDTVLFPAGVYHIDQQIWPSSDMALVGAGAAATTIRYVGASPSSMIRLSDRFDVELTGFTLDGELNPLVQQGVVSGGGGGHFIHAMAVRDLVDSGVFGPHGIYFDNTVVGARIERCLFDTIGLDSDFGSGIRVGNGSNDCVIVRNEVRNTGRGGIHVSGSTGAIVRGNRVSGSGQFVHGLGIELFGGSHEAIVEDNVIDHWLSVDTSDRSAIRRNVVSDLSGDVKFAGLELVGSVDVIFTDNVVDGGAHRGVSISNTTTKERVLFASNTIRGAETWGLQISGEPGSITQKFYFYDNVFEMTDADPPTQFANQGHAFRFFAQTGPINHVVLDSNQIVSNDGIGIQLGGDFTDQLVLRNNTIANNGGAALTTGFSGTGPFQGQDFLAEGNTVTGNAGGDVLPASVGFAGNAEPVATIRAKPKVAVGEEVRFGFLWNDDGAVGEALWDLGDGLPQTGQLVAHTYDRPGTYLVHLVVWDDGGRADHDVRPILVQ